MKEEEINIPVTILTGFLGSGKTTFLNHILESNPSVRYAIIENEFGEQGIDNELVIKPDETIVELNNGCLCCTLNDNLYEILNDLHDRRDEFDEIIIEATGVADPTGLAQPFIAHPLVKQHFPLTSIICLIDSELIEDQIESTEEALNQITFSDILLVNKVDLVNEAYVTQLKQKLKNLNPLATIYQGHIGLLPELDYRRNNEKLDHMLIEAHKDTNEAENQQFPIENTPHHHHHHTKDIKSLSFKFNVPFDLEKLRLQLSIFFTFQSKGLYRMKGLIWLHDEEHQYVLQSVGKRFDLTKKRLWKKNESKESTIVFIGKNLQRQGLERMLSSCLLNEQTETVKIEADVKNV